MQDNFSFHIIRYPSVDSTNIVLKGLAKEGAAEGTVVIAETQTAGRGRERRVWHSPKGGLYFSVLLRPKDKKRITDLSLLSGVAVVQAMSTLLPKAKDVSVKWPNDCLLDWKKAGGILCETVGEESRPLCVVGIGLNVNVSFEELKPFIENPFSATSFIAENGGTEFVLEDVFNTVLVKLSSLYRLYQTEGFSPIQFLWEKSCRFIGKKIQLSSGWRVEDRKGREESTVGVCLGIDDRGALVLSNPKGERRQYTTGEIICFWP